MLFESFAERLQHENDFQRYIDLLAEASQRYCVLVASYDTPCGSPHFTKDYAQKLRHSLGANISLYAKYRCSYIYIIDKGKRIFEQISDTTPIEYNGKLDNHKVYVYSMGFGMSDLKWVCISIDDNNPVYIARGLHFVVFDKDHGKIIDYIAFDTYNPETRKIPYQRNISTIAKRYEDFANCIKV